MNKRALCVMTAASLGWWGPVHAADLLGCLIEADRVADVGSQSTGVIERVSVERGDNVSAGQVVARLAAQVERASLSVAEARAKAEAETLQAIAAHELAQRKLERARDLVKRDFLSDQALDQAEAEARVAEQRVAQARESQRVAQREFNLSNAQLGQREIRSPFAGMVVERYRTEGERIEREPVIRVARLDPLRIEAIVPAAQFGTISAGQSATVKTDLPDYPMLTARVTLVDRVIDPASNSFRVRLVLPNPGNRVPSGVRCRIAFADAQPKGAAPAVPGAALVPPPAAGQVAPARWRRDDVVPGAIATVSAPVERLASVPLSTAGSGRPARFLSSTLKIAMAELARTTPGARVHDASPGVVAMDASAASSARKARVKPLAVFAMSTRLGSEPVPVTKPVTRVAASTRDAGHVNGVDTARAPETAPLSGVRLASVR